MAVLKRSVFTALFHKIMAILHKTNRPVTRVVLRTINSQGRVGTECVHAGAGGGSCGHLPRIRGAFGWLDSDRCVRLVFSGVELTVALNEEGTTYTVILLLY